MDALEKLGYKLHDDKKEYAVRVYDNGVGTTISFYDYVNYDGKTKRSVEKLRHKSCDEFTYEELLACAEVIKEEEIK